MPQAGGQIRDGLRRVLAPATPVADIEGVTVLLVSVELWTRSVYIRFAGMLTAGTDALDEEFGHALTAWHHGGRTGEHPEHPAHAIYREVKVSDDAGTKYRPRSSQRGGTGTEWRAEWKFVPGVPEEAARLTITVIDAQDRSHDVELQL